MKLNQCPNHHYYDGDLFAACPYCGSIPDGRRSIYAEPVETVVSIPEPEDGADAADLFAPVPAAGNDLTFGEDARTVSYFSRRIGVEPVVGWLVAVDGKYFGEDFRLKAGRNFIGRAPDMDVQLSLDPTVSRRKHAILVYEPKSRVFIAQPGESRELFYLNDRVVLEAAELKDRDILTIGETKLMLVTLCGPDYNWEE